MNELREEQQILTKLKDEKNKFIGEMQKGSPDELQITTIAFLEKLNQFPKKTEAIKQLVDQYYKMALDHWKFIKVEENIKIEREKGKGR